MWILILLVVCPLVFFSIEYGLDRLRIQKQLQGKDCQLLSLTRQFDHGLVSQFKKERQRKYDVVYTDGNGQVLEASCRTELMEGVFWTNGDIPQSKQEIGLALPREDIKAEIENFREMIREENQQYRRQRSRLENDIQHLQTQITQLRSQRF